MGAKVRWSCLALAFFVCLSIRFSCSRNYGNAATVITIVSQP